MLSYGEAIQILLAQVPGPQPVRVPLEKARGRVLAATIRADMDLPPFNKSFMDGYALRSADVSQAPVQLRLIGTIAAGGTETITVGAGEAAQIMTGAAVPAGADAIQIVEKARRVGAEKVEILEPVSQGQNISHQANEVKRGKPVLECGTIISSARLGVLALFGQTSVEVFKAPSVAIISTGNEIVEIDRTPQYGQIRNSNAHMLWSQCRSLGLETQILPIVPDDPDRIREAVERGFEKDLLVFSGGVSMGEFDFVHKVLRDLGIEICFHKVQIKPGKPFLVGRKEGRLIFGLPGNPVSAFVTFELFVRPAVRKWMGFRQCQLPQVTGELIRDAEQKPGRMFFKPACCFATDGGFRVEPIETKGSADLVAFARCNALMIMEAGVSHLPAGSSVRMLLLNHWSDES